MPVSPTAAPLATYRLQLHADFPFADAAAVADYLAALGVSHVYTSPILRSTAASTHGYDVVDPTEIDPELGGRAGYDRLSRRLGELGLGHVLDVVPNHMATSPESPWWRDVLAHGEESPHARVFDIDWQREPGETGGRVVVPILPRSLAEAIDAGEVTIERDPDDPRVPVVACAGQRLPLTVGDDERRRLVEELAAGPLAAERTAELLAAQRYRLTHWRKARTLLNYRRFFTITSLVGVRVGDPEVFAATHRTTLELVANGQVDGLRIDHPDGLRDPAGYLDRLVDAAGGVWTVVEKILEPGEALPPRWRAAGTTGYDFAATVGGLFVDPAGEPDLTALYAELTGEEVRFAEVAHAAKLDVVAGELAPEIERLTTLFAAACDELPEADRPSPFLLPQALVELLANFPVYRTYVDPERGTVDDGDVRAVTAARLAAARRRPELAGVLGVLADLLLLRRDATRRGAGAELVWRFQQTSGPVMAKAVEDCAFYRYARLAALAEVGADPGAFGTSPEDFHRFCLERQARWPTGLNALSTHDTKRSADVRARLAVLSERPGEWGDAVRRWAERAAVHRRGDWPERNLEYLLYQTLVGAHPLCEERAAAYLEKAAREAATRTTWIDPHPEYETAVRGFVAAVYADEELRADLAAFAKRLVAPGRVTSLAATLLLLTAPGVPDLYQGSELWDLSLVDPDNRRPVDYAARREALAALAAEPGPEAALSRMDDGWPKLWLIRRALDLRRRRPEVFGEGGAYRPLWPRGERDRHLVAFARLGPGGAGAVVAVPRLVAALGHDGRAAAWGDTSLALPPGRWRDVLGSGIHDGPAVAARDLFARFPVALLDSEPSA